MPTKKFGSKTIVDAAAVGLLIQVYQPDTAAIERVGARPGQGVTSMFDFGYSTGVVTGACAGAGVPVTVLLPALWRAWAGLRGNKSDARARAAEMFPDHAKALARKKDHGRAEAILIGYAAACIGHNALFKTPA